MPIMGSLDRVVVVGGGAAGVAAAESLRREGFAGSLVLLGDEPVLPYDRPPLSKQVLSGAWEQDRTTLREKQHYADLGIELRHARARGLDLGQHLVHVDDGASVPFDGLVIATGVLPRHLPQWQRLEGVHVLRGHSDVARLRAAFLAGGKVVIVGAGFLGMEVAASARGMDLDVTVAEPLPQPMIRQVGPEIGAVIAQLHRVPGEDAELTLEQGALGDEKFIAMYRSNGEPTAVLGWNAPGKILPYRKQLLA